MTEQPPSQPIQNPLTLVMKAKSPESWTELRHAVESLQEMPDDKNPIVAALDKIGTVHFARFAFLEDARQLLVITTYDGDFETYINEFVNVIGGIFDTLLAHVADAPPRPVQAHRQEFLDYIRAGDLRSVGKFYSAYPGTTVFDVLDMTGGR
ncbi:MAG: hypothetical protein ACRDTG_11800 [Pseudonocardiaceae bacterium]